MQKRTALSRDMKSISSGRQRPTKCCKVTCINKVDAQKIRIFAPATQQLWWPTNLTRYVGSITYIMLPNSIEVTCWGSSMSTHSSASKWSVSARIDRPFAAPSIYLLTIFPLLRKSLLPPCEERGGDLLTMKWGWWKSDWCASQSTRHHLNVTIKKLHSSLFRFVFGCSYS